MFFHNKNQFRRVFCCLPAVNGRSSHRPMGQCRASTVARLQEARGHSQSLAELELPFSVVVTASVIHGLQPLSAFFGCSVTGVPLSAVCSCPDAWVVVGVLLCMVLTACTDLSGEEASFFLARARPDDISNYCDSALRVGSFGHRDRQSVACKKMWKTTQCSPADSDIETTASVIHGILA